MQKRNMQKRKIYSGGSSTDGRVAEVRTAEPMPIAAADQPTPAAVRTSAAETAGDPPSPVVEPEPPANTAFGPADKMTTLLQKLGNDAKIEEKLKAGEKFFNNTEESTEPVEGAIKEDEDKLKKFTDATNDAITNNDVDQAKLYIEKKKLKSLEKVKLIHSKLSGLNILIDVTYDIVEIIIILLKGRQGTKRHTIIIKALIEAYNELNKHLNGIDEHINDKNTHLMDKFKDILGQLNDLNEKEKEKIIAGLGGTGTDLNKILIERVQGVLERLQTKIDEEEFFTAGFKLTQADVDKIKGFWDKIKQILSGIGTTEDAAGGEGDKPPADGSVNSTKMGGRKRKARKTKKRQHRGGYQYTKSRRSTRKVTSRSKGNRSKGSRSGRRSISKRTTRKSINKRGGRTTRRR